MLCVFLQGHQGLLRLVLRWLLFGALRLGSLFLKSLFLSKRPPERADTPWESPAESKDYTLTGKQLSPNFAIKSTDGSFGYVVLESPNNIVLVQVSTLWPSFRQVANVVCSQGRTEKLTPPGRTSV